MKTWKDLTTKEVKKIALLVIAACNKPVYIHYIQTYWAEVIKYTALNNASIDVFLLFEHGTDITEFKYLQDHIIIDENKDFNGFFEEKQRSFAIPGILSKTIFAFEKLVDKYDIFLRTNLSSMFHKRRLIQWVESKTKVIYSGGASWPDSLRRDLVIKNKVGPDKSISSLTELKNYRGNTFVSGSGFFINKEEVRYILNNKRKIRYDIIDDVSIGLMMSEYEHIPHFMLKLLPEERVSDMIMKIKNKDYIHVRLQNFPVKKAEELWSFLGPMEFWKN